LGTLPRPRLSLPGLKAGVSRRKTDEKRIYRSGYAHP
jgi:hypothetical protein